MIELKQMLFSKQGNYEWEMLKQLNSIRCTNNMNSTSFGKRNPDVSTEIYVIRRNQIS